jgi:hypothetical protein
MDMYWILFGILKNQHELKTQPKIVNYGQAAANETVTYKPRRTLLHQRA